MKSEETESTFDPDNIKELHRCDPFTLNKLASVVQNYNWMCTNRGNSDQLAAMKQVREVIAELKQQIVENCPKM